MLRWLRRHLPRRRTARVAAPHPAPRPVPAARAWQSLPPLVPTPRRPALTAAPRRFVRRLPGRRGVPRHLAPLSHDVRLEAPAGIVTGIARTAGAPPAAHAAPRPLPPPPPPAGARTDGPAWPAEAGRSAPLSDRGQWPRPVVERAGGLPAPPARAGPARPAGRGPAGPPGTGDRSGPASPGPLLPPRAVSPAASPAVPGPARSGPSLAAAPPRRLLRAATSAPRPPRRPLVRVADGEAAALARRQASGLLRTLPPVAPPAGSGRRGGGPAGPPVPPAAGRGEPESPVSAPDHPAPTPATAGGRDRGEAGGSARVGSPPELPPTPETAAEAAPRPTRPLVGGRGSPARSVEAPEGQGHRQAGRTDGGQAPPAGTRPAPGTAGPAPRPPPGASGSAPPSPRRPGGAGTPDALRPGSGAADGSDPDAPAPPRPPAARRGHVARSEDQEASHPPPGTALGGSDTLAVRAPLDPGDPHPRPGLGRPLASLPPGARPARGDRRVSALGRQATGAPDAQPDPGPGVPPPHPRPGDSPGAGSGHPHPGQTGRTGALPPAVRGAERPAGRPLVSPAGRPATGGDRPAAPLVGAGRSLLRSMEVPPGPAGSAGGQEPGRTGPVSVRWPVPGARPMPAGDDRAPRDPAAIAGDHGPRRQTGAMSRRAAAGWAAAGVPRTGRPGGRGAPPRADPGALPAPDGIGPARSATGPPVVARRLDVAARQGFAAGVGRRPDGAGRPAAGPGQGMPGAGRVPARAAEARAGTPRTPPPAGPAVAAHTPAAMPVARRRPDTRGQRGVSNGRPAAPPVRLEAGRAAGAVALSRTPAPATAGAGTPPAGADHRAQPALPRAGPTVQRLTAPPGPLPAPGAPGGPGSGPGAAAAPLVGPGAPPGPPAGAGDGRDVDALFQVLYPRVRDELRWELRVQRERAGLLADPL